MAAGGEAALLSRGSSTRSIIFGSRSNAVLLSWPGIMINFILRTALTGKWDTTWAYGVARHIAADTPP